MSREWTKIVLVSEIIISIDYVLQRESSRYRDREESEECARSLDYTHRESGRFEVTMEKSST